MKSVKYNFFPHYGRLRGATLFTRIVFLLIFFFRVLIGSTQFTTFFQFAIADLSEKWNFVRLLFIQEFSPYICKQKGGVYTLK